MDKLAVAKRLNWTHTPYQWFADAWIVNTRTYAISTLSEAFLDQTEDRYRGRVIPEGSRKLVMTDKRG